MEEVKISEGILTDDELDVLSGMMIIFMHSFEKLLSMTELHYEAQYRASKEYKQFVRMYGKAYVDNQLKEKVRNIVRGDDRNKLGKVLKAAKEFHREMENLTQSGVASHKEGITDADSLSAIVHDVNFLCYAYALMANTTRDDDEIKILSTLKLLAKGNRVSENLMNKLKIK